MKLETDFKDIFNTIPLPCVVIKKSGEIQYQNIAFENIFGRQKRNLYVLIPALCKHHIQHTQSTVPHGDCTYTVHTSSPKKGVSIVTFLDTTKAKSQQVNIARFVSHEIKTPLTSIKAYAELIGRKSNIQHDPSTMHYLKRIHTKIDEQTKMISDFVDISRAETGQFDFFFEEIPIHEVITCVVNEIRNTNPSRVIEMKGSSKAFVLADNVRLKQVFTVLLQNAVKYSPADKEVIVDIKDKQGSITITVMDHGIGIRKKNIADIFKPNIIEEKLKKRPGATGLGVGLYVASEIVGHMQGAISVKSTLKKGSEFTVELPIVLKR